MTQAPPKSLAYFLLFLCGIIVVIAIVGAITRLTQSGLSIMDWDFFKLFWSWPSAEEIDRYYVDYVENVPQYLVTNFTREEFVPAVFWEWFHRNIGKTAGVIAIIGTIYFFATRQVPSNFRWAVLAIAPLLGLQGVIGIFMVWSGYNTQEDVSHYRLALHLGTAFFAFGFYLWTALRILVPSPQESIPVRPWAWAFGALVITMVFGAYTAGLNAGPISHTWPNFNAGSFLPTAGQCADVSRGSLTYWIDSKCGVHFIHRHIAMIAAAVVVFASLRTFFPGGGRVATKRGRVIAYHGIAIVLAQVVLGIYLVIAGVPMGPAVAHQLGALAMLTIAVCALYFRRRAY